MNSQVALVVKNPPASAGDKRDMGLISGLGRSPGEGHGNPLQYSGLENSTDRGAWQATVCGVTKSETWLKWLSTHVLATPWLRLHASTAGGTGLIAGQGTRIPHATWLSQKQILKRGWFGEGPKPEMRTVCRIQRQRGGALRWQRWTWVISSETPVTESAQSRPAGEDAGGLLKAALQRETWARSGRCQQARRHPWMTSRKRLIWVSTQNKMTFGLLSPCTVVIFEGGNVIIFELHTSHKIMWRHADNDDSPRACVRLSLEYPSWK